MCIKCPTWHGACYNNIFIVWSNSIKSAPLISFHVIKPCNQAIAINDFFVRWFIVAFLDITSEAVWSLFAYCLSCQLCRHTCIFSRCFSTQHKFMAYDLVMTSKLFDRSMTCFFLGNEVTIMFACLLQSIPLLQNCWAGFLIHIWERKIWNIKSVHIVFFSSWIAAVSNRSMHLKSKVEGKDKINIEHTMLKSLKS